jgi:hypothetical protein
LPREEPRACFANHDRWMAAGSHQRGDFGLLRYPLDIAQGIPVRAAATQYSQCILLGSAM